MDTLRVVAIGRTGAGDWGHAIDRLWLNAPGTEYVAVADATDEGAAEAAARLGGITPYTDWRKMLADEKPDVVVICMRHVDCHAEMAIAAAEAGAKGIFIEKPFVQTPAEADAVIAACQKAGTKLVCGFVNRYSETFARVREMIDDGRIGQLLELRGRGKEDARGGGEDLWVLGSHILDMMASLGGAPQWCQASVSEGGRLITKADAIEGPEGLGRIAGDAIHAMWGLADGPIGFFSSVREAGLKQPPFGLMLIGSSGSIHIRSDQMPHAFIRRVPLWRVDRDVPWQPILPDGTLLKDASEAASVSNDERSAERASWGRRAVVDLLDAIREDREPETGMFASRRVVEMTASVYSSALTGERVSLPLTSRENPLA